MLMRSDAALTGLAVERQLTCQEGNTMVRPTAHADEYDKTHTQEVLLDPNSELFPRATPAMNAVTLAQSYNRLQLIYRLGKAICEETELDRVLALVQEALIRLIALERCFIATFDGHGRLEALTTHNIVLDHGLENWPVSKSLIRRVLKDRVALLSADAQQDTQFEGIHSIGIHNIHSVMCIPLGSEGSCIGLIYADHRGKTGSFSPDDLLFVTALSHYIYLGIHNANKIAIALEKQRISDDRVVALQQDLLRNDIKIIGQSKSLQESLRLLERVASTNLPVLLLGERGTGKELFAKALHKRNTQRANKIFMPANIAAFTETLMEAELFGTVRGAFTGAIDKPGKLELADGGTLFLDEIADIPLSAQT